MPNQRIVVTGGAGFIGSHLVDALIAQNPQAEVAILDDLSFGKKENINKQTDFYKQDITNKEAGKLIKKIKPQVIFHLAAQKSVTHSVADPRGDLRTNLVGLLNLLEAAKDISPQPKIIFSSTGGAIYGDGVKLPTPETAEEAPASPYGITKLASEKYLNFYRRQYGLKTGILRFANVYGPRQDPDGEAGVIAIFSKRALKGEPLTIFGDGKQTRDYIFVSDVTWALLAAAQKPHKEPLNIGTGRETSVLDLVEQLQKIIGSKIKVNFAPVRPGEQKRSVLDIDKARQVLGFKAKTDLAHGIAQTVQWFKQNPNR